MTSHPRERWAARDSARPGTMSRRDLLRAIGAGAGAAGLGALLSACGDSADAALPTSILLPRKNRPVRWPVFEDNKPIASGLKPEYGATLKIYNWTAYINTQCITNFCKKYKCNYELTSFNTMTEAIAKVKSGEANYDVFVPTVDTLGELIEARLIQPLNHSYIPNLAGQCWPDYQNPFYDLGWQYTVPYTIYTTGVSWRKDYIHDSPYRWKNGWSFLWQSKYAGKVAILDDYRESPCLGLMYNNLYDLNTTSREQLDRAMGSLTDLNNLVGGVQIDNNDYTNIPSGQAWIHHSWSGDMAAAPAYLPKGVSPDVIGYWFPTNGVGPVANDTMTILAGSQSPVLAHLFLNYMEDLPNALENISYNGYMQPLTGVTPEVLLKEKILYPGLISTVVLPDYFRKGIFELELPPSADVLWEEKWLEFSGGI
jgi:spermidine/putrescine transport system substrate-binding protein